MKKNKSLSENRSDKGVTDNNIIKYYVTVYLFYGFVFFIFGTQIESFFKNLSYLQEQGLKFIFFALASHTLYIAILKRKTTLTLRVINFVMSVTLFITILVVMTEPLILSVRQISFFALFFFNTIFFLSTMSVIRLEFIIRNLNKSITDPREKITLLIGFFGVLISFLTILK